MVGWSDHCHFVPVDRVAAKEVLHLLSNLERGGGEWRRGRRKEKRGEGKGREEGGGKREEGRKGVSEGKWTRSGVINFAFC